MRGLTVILVEPSPARFRAALELLAAQAALGGRARLFAQGAAVALLAGAEPLMAEARALGVELIACQTGLAEASLALPEGVAAGGPVAVLRTLGEDRLVMV